MTHLPNANPYGSRKEPTVTTSTSALGSDLAKEELGSEPPEARAQILLLSPE